MNMYPGIGGSLTQNLALKHSSDVGPYNIHPIFCSYNNTYSTLLEMSEEILKQLKRHR
eukprot:UN12509